MTISLSTATPPAHELDLPRVSATTADYRRRSRAAYSRASTDWLAVYGDREHAGNLYHLCGYDPRFEEALLLIGPDDACYLLVGNEGVVYAADHPEFVSVALAQSFSLMGQDRGVAPSLEHVMRSCGVRLGDEVTIAGWKYLEAVEQDRNSAGLFVPHHIVSCLASITGTAPRDGAAIFLSPVDGLRTLSSPLQIAAHARAAHQTSAAVFATIAATRPGVDEDALARVSAGTLSDPHSMHTIVASGSGQINGLRSSNGRIVEKGEGIVHAVGTWYSLTCRAGLVDTYRREFFEETVAPYFSGVATWLSCLKDGASGGDIWNSVNSELATGGLSSSLNPGHIISMEEWTHSPIRRGSADKVLSGMVLQSDIIPTPMPDGTAINCEDTVAIADAGLRREIRESYPRVWESIERNRHFLSTVLGVEIHDDVLPLSPTTGYLPPFWLLPKEVCVMS